MLRVTKSGPNIYYVIMNDSSLEVGHSLIVHSLFIWIVKIT